MSILKDILEIVRDIDGVTVDEIMSGKKYKSLSKRSKEGILQFPVLTTKNLDFDTIMMVSKSLERNYSSFLQVALSMDPVSKVDVDKDGAGYLRKFHQNMGTRADLYDVHNFITDVVREQYEHFKVGDAYLCAKVYEGATNTVIYENKECLHDTLSDLNMNRVNDLFKPQDPLQVMMENNKNSKSTGKSVNNTTNNTINRAENNVDHYTNPNNTGTIITNYNSGTNQKATPMITKRPNDKMLKDNDARKANELVPTTLHVNLTLVGSDNSHLSDIDFVIGVKTVVHPIESDEMVSNIVSACRSNEKIFDFVRWTSGEISFVKDFLLNISEIKDDVVQRSAGSSPWWIALKRRKSLSKFKNKLFIGKNLLPNTTLVLTQEEVDFIATEYKFDLNNENFVRKVMAEYFLLGFVIVDNAKEITHFLFDGEDYYQSLTFDSLKREAYDKGADLKELMAVINRA